MRTLTAPTVRAALHVRLLAPSFPPLKPCISPRCSGHLVGLHVRILLHGLCSLHQGIKPPLRISLAICVRPILPTTSTGFEHMGLVRGHSMAILCLVLVMAQLQSGRPLQYPARSRASLHRQTHAWGCFRRKRGDLDALRILVGGSIPRLEGVEDLAESGGGEFVDVTGF
jgi:hypothetical protein